VLAEEPRLARQAFPEPFGFAQQVRPSGGADGPVSAKDTSSSFAFAPRAVAFSASASPSGPDRGGSLLGGRELVDDYNGGCCYLLWAIAL
jgi:hypothetical protein